MSLVALVVCLTVAPAAAQTPATGWNSIDIGPTLPGGTSPAYGGFYVYAAGADVWNQSDEFRFVYRQLAGDGAIVTRLSALNATSDYTKAGVMIRESLAANSTHAFMMLTGAVGLAFQYRTATGGSTAHAGASWSGAVWLKIERSGSTLTGSYSSNGTNWTTLSQANISMAGTVYIGVALSSNTPQTYAAADFTNVTQTGSQGSSGGGGSGGSSEFTSSDIGAVALAGSTSTTSSGITIQASGTDIWNDSDEFRFVYRQLTGDGDIVARLSTLSSADPWTKAGVMIRESLAANSKHAFMLQSGSAGTAFQRRAVATGGWTENTTAGWPLTPVWLKLERRGSTVTAFESSNGVTWTTVGSDTIVMNATVYVGLALTSHSMWRYATADFTNISVSASTTPTPSGSWTSTDIGSPTLGGSTAPYDNGYAVSSASLDVWGSSDQFRFVYAPLVGDGTITTFVANLSLASAWTKGGVMIRESLASNSKHAFMLVTGTQGLAFQRRTSTGGTSSHTAGPSIAAPIWLRLQRQGSTLTGAYSWDRVNWATVGTATISMGSTVYAGVAVSSQLTSAYATGYFTNLGLDGSTPAPSPSPNQPPSVSLTSPASGATFTPPATISLAATASDADGIARVDFYAGSTLIGSDSSSPYSATWSGVGIGTYSITAVARDATGGTTVSSERIISVLAAATTKRAVFTPSANHYTAVAHYVLDIFPVWADPNSSSPLASLDLGLPAIVNGEIQADITGVTSQLPGGTYIVTVTAVGSGGSTRSAPAQFTQ